MNNKRVYEIKRAQKKAQLLRILSSLFVEASLDNEKLFGFYINRIELSPDKSNCYVYFCAPRGKDDFKENLELLKLYKPSMRAALSKQLNGRYTPQLTFRFDELHVKARNIDDLLNKLKDDGEL